MKVVTGAEMAAIDRRTIEEFGIPGQTLMESAGRATVDQIRCHYPEVRRLLVVCGPGNNGGDGLVIARTWHNQGGSATVYLATERYGGDAALNLERARNLGLPIVNRLPSLQGFDLVVDALFGTGLKRPLEDPIVDLLNAAPLPRVAVDIASGIDSATGHVLGKAIQADLTVTFGLAKLGHWLQPGRSHTGQLVVTEIGFPRSYLQSDALRGNLLDAAQAREWFPLRTPTTHKGTAGRVLLAVGSSRYPGAAVLAARAALRMGAGLVFVAAPARIQDIILSHNPEAIVLPTPGHPDRWVPADVSWLEEQLDKKHAFLLGPGCGDHAETRQAMAAMMALPSLPPLIVDADAIADVPEGLPGVITPHHGELARRLGLQVSEIEEDRLGVARRAAQILRCAVLLKGNPTLTVSPQDDFYLNTSGGPLLAQGGSGDVLSGTIVALLGQGLSPTQAAALGAYLHGRSADLQSPHYGDRGLLAREIADGLVAACRQLSKVSA